MNKNGFVFEEFWWSAVKQLIGERREVMHHQQLQRMSEGLKVGECSASSPVHRRKCIIASASSQVHRRQNIIVENVLGGRVADALITILHPYM